MAATLKDVARQAGVSPSTVSRVVRGLPVVSDEVKRRVDTAIALVGYRPDAGARSIRTGYSQAVGFVVPDISNWFYSMVFQGAQDVLYEAGYDLMLATSNAEFDRERHAVDSLLSRRVNGLILSLADEESAHLAGSMAALPTVLLDREYADAPADVVLSDHASGMAAVVRHLVDLGHRRIALLTGTPSLYSSRARREAFQRTARALGLRKPDLLERSGDRSVAAGERSTTELLLSADPPTAVVAGSNQLLHGALLAMHRLGVEPPRDVSLVSCDDTPISQLHRPAITAVNRDVQLMGTEAAKVLLQRFAETKAAADGGDRKRRPPLRRVLPTTFVERESTGRPPRRTRRRPA